MKSTGVFLFLLSTAKMKCSEWKCFIKWNIHINVWIFPFGLNLFMSLFAIEMCCSWQWWLNHPYLPCFAASQWKVLQPFPSGQGDQLEGTSFLAPFCTYHSGSWLLLVVCFQLSSRGLACNCTKLGKKSCVWIYWGGILMNQCCLSNPLVLKWFKLRK